MDQGVPKWRRRHPRASGLTSIFGRSAPASWRPGRRQAHPPGALSLHGGADLPLPLRHQARARSGPSRCLRRRLRGRHAALRPREPGNTSVSASWARPTVGLLHLVHRMGLGSYAEGIHDLLGTYQCCSWLVRDRDDGNCFGLTLRAPVAVPVPRPSPAMGAEGVAVLQRIPISVNGKRPSRRPLRGSARPPGRHRSPQRPRPEQLPSSRSRTSQEQPLIGASRSWMALRHRSRGPSRCTRMKKTPP